jgi:Fe-S-cluster-containing dehydrogenase component
MQKWNLIVDVANCTNCNVCALAVQDEHVGNAFPGYAEEMPKHGHRWIEIKRRERGTPPVTDVAYLPTMCQHCDDAPCIAAAPDAITKRPDGIVVIDPVKSKGRRDLVEACPYGAIWWNDEKEVPQHWFFDAHLLDDGWAEPRCVTVCATNALKSVKIDDTEMKRMAEAEGLELLRPDLATKPRVYYKNLWRYNSVFIAGTVSHANAGRTECLEDAAVSLLKGGAVVATQSTDIFGDFKFDGLQADNEEYEVQVSANGDSTNVSVTLDTSKTVGEIHIDNSRRSGT